MGKYPADSYYLKAMKNILDSYPQHSPPLHPTQLTDQLYIGNQDNADDIVLLKELGITHVLNCVGSRNFDFDRSPYPPEVNIKGFLIIPAQDFDEFNIMKFFGDAIGFIDSAVLNGGNVLVHCSIGVNRSGAIVAAYLMVSQKKNLLDVIVELKAKRFLILCNMGFRKQLVEFARANDLLDEVTLPDSETKAEENKIKDEELSTTDETEEKSTFRFDDSIDDADEIKIKDIIIDLKKLEKKAYPSKNKIETIDEAKRVLIWSKLKDEEKLELLSDKIHSKEKSNADFNGESSSSKNLLNVDPSIMLKVMNESYDKYKKTHKLSFEYKYDNRKVEPKSLFRRNLEIKNKRNESDLNKEVEDFLSATSSPVIKKYSEVRNLLEPLKNKEKITSRQLLNLNQPQKSNFQTSSNFSSKNIGPLKEHTNLKEISQYVNLDPAPSSYDFPNNSGTNKSNCKLTKPTSYYKSQLLNNQNSKTPLLSSSTISSLLKTRQPLSYNGKSYKPIFSKPMI